MFTPMSEYGIFSAIHTFNPSYFEYRLNNLQAAGIDLDVFMPDFTPFRDLANYEKVIQQLYTKKRATIPDYFMFEREDIISVNYFDFDSELTLALAQWYDCDPFYVAKHIRSGYHDQQSNNIYYVTGVGYDCISSDLLGKESNKEAYAQFIEQYDIIL